MQYEKSILALLSFLSIATSQNTSIEVLKALVTNDRSVTTSPTFIGSLKETLSTLAVTEMQPACLKALTPEATIHPVEQVPSHEITQWIGLAGHDEFGVDI